MTELPASHIDRSSPVPFYFQLKRLLSDEIEAGRWTAGTRMPSEPSICQHFDVSRTTVRQALAELEGEGLIRKEKGRGTFVAEKRSSSWLLQSAHGFFEEASREGQKVRSRVLRAERSVLPTWACHALGLKEGSEGVTLERVRWVDERIVMYVETHLPAELAEVVLSADLESGSLYATLREQMGKVVCLGRRVVEAMVARDELATILELEPGSPLLFVEAISLDEAGRPFECYRAWHRGDRTKIEVQVMDEAAVARAGFDPTNLRLGR